MAPVVGALLLLGALGSSDAPSRDGLLVEAAAVPQPGTVRVSGVSGATPATDDGAPGYTIGGSLLWSMGANLAAGFAATNEAGRLTPAVSLRWQLLHQHDAALDLTGLVRFKSVGLDPAGPEMEAEAAVGRTLGRVLLLVNGVAGTGLSGQRAVDVELKAGVTWSALDELWLGAQARVRQEVGAEADANAGRDRDAVAGATLAWRAGEATLQALAGWGAPRGTAPAGPVVVAQLSVDL